MLREIKSPQRLQREVSYSIEVTAGVPALSEGKFRGTIVKNGTGDWTITFKHPYTRAPQVFVGNRTASRISYCSASSITACTIKTVNLSAAAADGDLYVKVVGWDAADQA